MKRKDVIANLLRRGPTAAMAEEQTVRNRVQFPLVECKHPAKPGEELTPERVAEILLEGEISDLGIVR